MITYAQIEQALTQLGYEFDLDHFDPPKLTAVISVDGYKSPVTLEFREGWESELGDVEPLFQVEWLMNDHESCLLLDINSLDLADELPDIFVEEKVILRNIFDQLLAAIASVATQD
ncbi:MAG: hypothetical protein NW214_06715 [Pseudanabaenaceae cyanobacterium bins.39]|nr:hypothetical protein [Pseudanabaenaceae cyanobacterium bins.39]